MSQQYETVAGKSVDAITVSRTHFALGRVITLGDLDIVLNKQKNINTEKRNTINSQSKKT